MPTHYSRKQRTPELRCSLCMALDGRDGRPARPALEQPQAHTHGTGTLRAGRTRARARPSTAQAATYR